MKVEPSVVSVSLFIGVQRKIDCTGLIIHWDDPTGKATVLTCAKLLRIPKSEDRDTYYIVVRLPDGNILLAEEDYVDFCHNIITLKVSSDAKLEPVDLDLPSPEIEEGIEVVSLSRDFHTCSLLEGSRIINIDYPYFGCEQLVSSTCSGSEVGEGGPLITRFGHVCGINFFDGYKSYHPLPISVIRSCLKQWDTHNIVVQPWFGLTLINISELPIDALETMAKVFDVTATATVIK
ncbi:uncharacterized protein LOC141675509 isoform X1 [Apium graveolens]|uniref:uncharacterized protein LOC141675509 isoform X1 n=1 Tax=Apium graveolens TaxID=4045 RepID=UPI003D7C12E0